MKYLLRIMFLSFLIIPFMIWEFLLAVWVFRYENLKDLWADYKDTVGYNLRKAFPRHYNKSRTF